MARRYRMTPARRAALKKAQAASARKRRRRNRKIATAVGVVGATAVVGAAAYSGHKLSGSAVIHRRSPNVSASSGKQLSRLPRLATGKSTVLTVPNFKGTHRTQIGYRFGRENLTGRPVSTSRGPSSVGPFSRATSEAFRQVLRGNPKRSRFSRKRIIQNKSSLSGKKVTRNSLPKSHQPISTPNGYVPRKRSPNKGYSGFYGAGG